MKPKIREILEDCISTGIDLGLSRAHKHTDNPTDLNIESCIELAIWYEIDEKFDFGRDLASEMIEGLKCLRENI
jgi:hypothetical protein